MTLALPDGPVVLRNATVPACLIGGAGDLARVDLGLEGGKLVAPAPGMAEVDLKRRAGAACLHRHAHPPRQGPDLGPEPQPGQHLSGRARGGGADRERHWSPEDVRRRMDFALRTAFALGPGRSARIWTASRRRMRSHGRCSRKSGTRGRDGSTFRPPRLRVATWRWTRPSRRWPTGWQRIAAPWACSPIPCPTCPTACGTSSGWPRTGALMPISTQTRRWILRSSTLAQIAEAAIETGFQGRIVAGHCCSLSTMPEGQALRTLDLCAKAGIGIVSLPMCNLYLQDRHPARTPATGASRWCMRPARAASRWPLLRQHP